VNHQRLHYHNPRRLNRKMDELTHNQLITVFGAGLGITWSGLFVVFSQVINIRGDHVRRSEFNSLIEKVDKIAERQAVVLDRLNRHEEECNARNP
jgi:hypothetical protein